ncbi:MAG: TonB-dependent receptor, partial [Alphaproteobacteria bacterium]
QGERFTLTLIGEGEVRDQSGTIYRAIQADPVTGEDLGLVIRGNGRDADTDLGAGTRDDGRIVSLTGLIDYDLGFATFSSITGVRTHRYHYKEDFDGTPLVINNYFQDQKGDYYSQEFRLVSTADGPFSWFAGVSGYREKIDAHFAQQADEELMCEAFEGVSCAELLDGDFTPDPLGLFETNDARGRYQGVAAFLDLTYALTPRFELNTGVRYTYDRKSFAMRINPVSSDLGPFFVFGYITDPNLDGGFVKDRKSWDQLTPRFTARWRASDDWSFWASVTKGYKAGGFGTFSLNLPTPQELGFTPAEIQACADEELGIFCVVNDDGTVPAGTKPSAFDPEKVWSYEIGAKASAFDGRLDLDLNGYYYRYKDLQITFFDETLLNTLVENVGRVNGLGVEATLRARPDAHWDFLLTAAWSHTSVHRVPEAICTACDGNRLTQNPKWTFGAFAAWYQPWGDGRLAVSTDLHAQTGFFGGLDNLRLTRVEGYADVTLRIAYEADAGWELAAHVANLFNDLYYDGANDGEFPIPSTFFGPSRPRSFGIDFVWRFGG